MPLPSAVDVAIVGAGAAGIAAWRTLRDSGVTVLLLEARDRPGGRAWTASVGGFPQDLGCGWLHSAEGNAWTKLVEPLGFTLDKTPPPWMAQAFDLGFSAEEQAAFREAYAAFDTRTAEAAKRPDDGPAAACFEPGGRWNALMDAVSSFYNGVQYGEVSVKDYAAFVDTEVNWRVTEGYGALIAAAAEGAPAVFGCPVRRIDRTGTELVLETDSGSVTARAAIVTVSTRLLAEERIRFDPPLPEKTEAAAGLPLGLADKLLLALNEPGAFPADSQLLGRTDSAETAAYHLRPFGRPLIEAYFGGAHAEALEAEGERALAAFALEELASLLGSSVRRTIRPLRATLWGEDPWAGGSYSYARVGCAGLRAVLAAPVEGRLFFAGEACSSNAFSTAHGAYETGAAAAEAALAALQLRNVASGDDGG